jgi:hypothetical protein
MDAISTINEIKAYIDSIGGLYSGWYVGISKDARYRLFVEHNVNENSDFWIFRTTFNSDIARQVEKYFISVLRAVGGTGGGDNSTNMVYAYKINSHTNQ